MNNPAPQQWNVQGVVPPMITPLAGQEQLDVPGLERLIEHLISGGVHGLFLLGTTGESTCLSYALRRELIRRSCAFVNGRVPVVVGVIDTAVEESVRLGCFAAECGAQAIVVAPPFVMAPGQVELRAYLLHLLRGVPLPILLYHSPPLTRTLFELETVRWAMERPQIIGLKDSSGDLAFFESLCQLLPHRPDWRLFIGPEALLVSAVNLGGHGGISGGANLFPRLYVRLFQAAQLHDLDAVSDLQARVEAVGIALYQFESHPTSFIKGLKAALEHQQICRGEMALPFAKLSPDHQRVLVQNLEKLIVQVGVP